MPETPQQYTARILATLGGQPPLEVLTATPAKLSSLVKGKSSAEIARKPAPGKWSVAEIIAHLADVEMVIGYRLRKILEADGTAIQAYDQDVWAGFSNYEAIPLEESLHKQTILRASNLRLLRSLKPEQWQCYGMHAERGRETVQRVAEMTAGHDLNHLAQIEKIFSTR